MKHLPFKGCIPLDYPNGSVTQWFGENVLLYKPYNLDGHNGIDLVSQWGTPLLAVDDGKIVDRKDDEGGYGKHIRLLSTSNVEWTYGHLSSIIASIGQEVKAGDVIGLMGNTGHVVSGATPFWEYNPYAGTHLHLTKRQFMTVEEAVKITNDWIPSWGLAIVNYKNGLKGAIDFKQELLDCYFEKKELTPEQKVQIENARNSLAYIIINYASKLPLSVLQLIIDSYQKFITKLGG